MKIMLVSVVMVQKTPPTRLAISFPLSNLRNPIKPITNPGSKEELRIQLELNSAFPMAATENDSGDSKSFGSKKYVIR